MLIQTMPIYYLSSFFPLELLFVLGKKKNLFESNTNGSLTLLVFGPVFAAGIKVPFQTLLSFFPSNFMQMYFNHSEEYSTTGHARISQYQQIKREPK